MNSALFQKGFRPFFLAAAIFAAIWIPLWSARVSASWHAAWAGPSWHAHEMLFGFFAAIITGFLLTAVENWTQQKAVNSRQLFVLLILWAAGRLVMVGGHAAGPLMIFDVAFLPAVAFFVARPIYRTKNRRNYVIPVILIGLSVVNLTSHIAVAQGQPEIAQRALLVGVFVVTALVLMVGGRVIPFFTANATGKLTSSNPALEKALMVGAAGLVVLQAVNISWLLGFWMIALGLGVLIRMKNWQTPTALKIPMLAILHVGHAWLGLGLLVSGINAFVPFILPNLGLHIITMGGLSTISLGMMARVAMGHTGRKIEATPSVVAAFSLINIAVVVRGIVPVFAPAHYVSVVIASSVVWAVAFGIYLFKFIPVLTIARPDGRPG
jgi:uncharacterized protein involved in response to NO